MRVYITVPVSLHTSCYGAVGMTAFLLLEGRGFYSASCAFFFLSPRVSFGRHPSTPESHLISVLMGLRLRLSSLFFNRLRTGAKVAPRILGRIGGQGVDTSSVVNHAQHPLLLKSLAVYDCLTHCVLLAFRALLRSLYFSSRSYGLDRSQYGHREPS